jgi:pimeloyl-ACP methyl ester carboxylesterase
MPRALVATGMELEYDTFGSPDDPTLLLVMGFTAQMIQWDERFCGQLADTGLHVVRFDNRDCGLSTKLDGVVVDTGAVMAAALGGGDVPEVPYTLSDMAADGIGLLDHLGVERAHVMGASMGGMIVQTMAIEHPTRVRSVISVMSTTGDPSVGQAAPEVLGVLLSPAATTREEYIETSPKWMVWHSKKHRSAERTKELAAVAWDRSNYAEGGPRQMAAIFASGDRTERLRQLDVPALVIHGRDDTLITPSGGLATADAIPGAHLLYLADMGHDIPEPLWPIVVDAVAAHTRVAV